MSDFKNVFYDYKAMAEQKRERSEIIAMLSYDQYVETRPYIIGKNCLDIGIGSGWSMQSILDGGALHCDGVDISGERIAQADEFLKSHGYSNYTLKQADAEDLAGISSDNYDYVNYLDIIEHLPDPQKGISEVHRVLKKGGMAYIKTPNHFTDNDLKLHHFGQLLCSLLMPGLIAGPSEDQTMLRDDMERLTEEQKETLSTVIPEGFHEHMHQYYPDELYNAIKSAGFEIVRLSGTPLFSDILYNNEAHLGHLSTAYADFVKSGGHGILLKALFQDLAASGCRPAFADMPPEYILSDSMIVVAQKI